MTVQTSGCPEEKIKALAGLQTVTSNPSTKICSNNYTIICAKKNTWVKMI